MIHDINAFCNSTAGNIIVIIMVLFLTWDWHRMRRALIAARKEES